MLRSLHLAALLVAPVPVIAAVADMAAAAPSVGEAQVSLPPVRRVAVAPVSTNLDEFRRFLREDARHLSGFAALPLNEDEASRELTNGMAKALHDSGRFWTLSVDATTDALQPRQGEQSLQSARERLQNHYDLDVWLETALRFSPDHTRVRVTMRNARGASSIWAREDVLIASSPSAEELLKAFHTAVARLMGTLGHDGRVSWRRDDLMVVDFGRERGVAPGHRLGAGYVALSARHPVTHEFLRARRLDVLELEVVEAREGSSLCRVVRKNDVMEQEARALFGGKALPVMLAWRQGAARPAELASHDVAAGAEMGFPEEMPQPQPRASEPPEEPKPSAPPKPVPVNNPAPRPEPEPVPVEERPAPATGPQPLVPSSWDLLEVAVGGGVSLGSMDTSKGSMSTGLPSTILNLGIVEASLRIGPQLRIAPELAGAFYYEGDAEGEKFDAAAPVLYRVVGGETPTDETGVLDVGGGPAVSLGSASTRIVKLGKRVRVEQGFDAPDALALASYGLRVPGLGEMTASIGLYVVEILMDEGSGVDVKLQVRPHAFLPKPVSFWCRGRLGPGVWSAGELGVKWSLVGVE